MNKFEKFIYGTCELIQLGSIIGLAVIGLKRNQDCYKAECKAIELQCDLWKKEIEEIQKDVEIKKLKQEVSELKTKYESEVEEA